MRWICSILLLVLAGCAVRASASASARDPLAEGRRLYVAKCAKCHKLYDPARYSDQEWKSWMLKMGKKAKLKPQQQEDLSQYTETILRAKAAPAQTR